MNYGKMKQIIKEILQENIIKKINEAQENMNNYTHLAVNKETNLIVDGWDYSDVDPQELKQFKRDYFTVDLQDNGFNPNAFKIVTTKYAQKHGITEWSNTGAFPIDEENKMQADGQNPFELAHEQHPDFYID